MMRGAASVFVCVLAFAMAAQADQGDTLYIQEEVDLVEEPSPQGPVMLQLEPGHKLVELERVGSWVKVGVFAIGASGEFTGFVADEGWLQSAIVASEPPGGDVPEEVAAADEEAEPEDEPRETPVERDRANADSLALIEKLLAKSDISDDLREELEGYKTDIEEGEFTAGDRRYLRALSQRLSKR